MALELVQGTVDVLILKTLTQGPRHGYGISSTIRRRSDGELVLEDAALYRALHRLGRQGWIRAEGGVSENNRRARYYQLTPACRRELHDSEAWWRQYVEAVFKALQVEESEAQ